MRVIPNMAAAVAAAITFVLAATAVQAQTATTTGAAGTNSTKPAPANTLLAANAAAPAAATEAPAAASATETPGPAAAGAAELQEVTVTGSRVITNGMDSPTPVTVVPLQEMSELMPSGTVADALNTLPQFTESRGPQSNPDNGAQGSGTQATNPAANVLNLRNMGTARTLILFDGHRIAPSGTDGSVDIDVIPQMLLQRVDIVTGGASAVYGSDAVTGVVNFVPDTHFNGLKVKGSAGISHYKDDRTVDFGIAAGTNLFDGKGHIEASAETYNNGGVDHRSDRPFGRLIWTVENPTNGTLGPFVLGEDVKSSRSSFGGVIIGGPLNYMEFSQNGILTPFNLGTPLGPNEHEGGSGAYGDATLSAPLAMNQLYVRLDYDFTDSVHAYTYALGNYSHTWAQAGNNGLSTPNGSSNGVISLSSTDAFLPPQYAAILAKAGPTFTMGEDFTDIPATNVDTWSREFQAGAGVNVKLGHGWESDTFYSRSLNIVNERNNSSVNTVNLVAALNAVVNPANNQIVCAVSLTQYASLYPGCAPFNPFGPNAASPAAINFIDQVTQSRAYTVMDDVTTTLSGTPFSTWAGPVPVALSAEWRGVSYHLDVSGIVNGPNNEVNCQGLPSYDCTSNISASTYGISAPLSVVTQNVGEGALEFNAPLLKDVFLAKEISFNGAGRWTEYNTSGPSWTWKGGLVWHVNDQLTLRGTRSKDIRAPVLNDLYQPPSNGLTSGPDYWTHVNTITPSVPNIAKGNPMLVPEIGNTSTVGLVFQPTILPGLSLSVDAFKIDVSNAIQQFRGANQSTQVACPQSGGTSAFCQLVVRPINCCSSAVANTFTELFTESLNLADQWTEGTDLEVDYSNRIQGHPFSVRALATYQPQLVLAAPGSAQYNLAGVAFATGSTQASPIWRASLLARYSPFHNFTIDARERWRDTLAWGAKYAPPATLIFSMPQIPAVEYTDLTLSYLFDHTGPGQTEVYASVTNLFNRQPPPAAYSGQAASGLFGGFAQGDDVIGAYYTVGFRFSL